MSQQPSKTAHTVELLLRLNPLERFHQFSYQNFNEVVWIDEYYLDEVRIIHWMDLVFRLSTIKDVESATMKDEVVSLDSSWV